MNINYFGLVLIFLFSLTVSCSLDKESSEYESQTVKIDESQVDFKMPAALWKLMLSEAENPKPSGGEHGNDKSKEHSSGASSSEMVPLGKESHVVFVPLKIQLVEKNEGILK